MPAGAWADCGEGEGGNVSKSKSLEEIRAIVAEKTAEALEQWIARKGDCPTRIEAEVEGVLKSLVLKRLGVQRNSYGVEVIGHELGERIDAVVGEAADAIMATAILPLTEREEKQIRRAARDVYLQQLTWKVTRAAEKRAEADAMAFVDAAIKGEP